MQMQDFLHGKDFEIFFIKTVFIALDSYLIHVRSKRSANYIHEIHIWYMAVSIWTKKEIHTSALFFFLAVLRSLWDPSSPSRGQTRAPRSESAKS